MQYLYLDESGDLGFDFVNKNPSKFLTLAILSVNGTDNNRRLINTVKRTIRKKLKPSGGPARLELKASKAAPAVIEYFLGKLAGLEIRAYTLTLNKKRLFASLTRDKSRIYNYIARLVVDRVAIEPELDCVEFIIDRSKGKKEIHEFDEYVKKQLQGRIDPERTRFIIKHEDSCLAHGLQAVDSISWAVFRKYERKDNRWLGIIKNVLEYESLYLPEK